MSSIAEHVALPPWALIAYLVSGVLFILALRGLSSPATSRTGNRQGMVGMAIAMLTTMITQAPIPPGHWWPRPSHQDLIILLKILAALGLGAIAAAPAPAFAHEGHDHGTDPVVTDPGGDHGDPTDPGTPDPGDTGDGAGALDWSNYERVLLTKNVGEPIDLAVLPDKRVLHTARNGDVRLTDPATGVTRVTSVRAGSGLNDEADNAIHASRPNTSGLPKVSKTSCCSAVRSSMLGTAPPDTAPPDIPPPDMEPAPCAAKAVTASVRPSRSHSATNGAKRPPAPSKSCIPSAKKVSSGKSSVSSWAAAFAPTPSASAGSSVRKTCLRRAIQPPKFGRPTLASVPGAPLRSVIRAGPSNKQRAMSNEGKAFTHCSLLGIHCRFFSPDSRPSPYTAPDSGPS